MAYNWVPVMGKLEQTNDTVIFKGGLIPNPEGQARPEIGNLISNQAFGGGRISADIKFLGKSPHEACEFILHYDPTLQAFTSAGIGAGPLCGVRTYSGRAATQGQWVFHGGVGDRDILEPNRVYRLEVTATGSRVALTLDEVEVLVTNLPFVLPRGQAGLWCMGTENIHISNFKVTPEEPRVFVIMQFTTPYNELYSDVIKPICHQLGLKSIRADETFGPGIIIADIERSIAEAATIIAEITPSNPNVYYEVGYARALNKPTILIAEKATQLPFNVSPFRTLLYENTIAGKNSVEAGLREHLQAIRKEWLPS